MTDFAKKKIKRMCRMHTDHVWSADFSRFPKEIKESFSGDFKDIFIELPLMRLQESKIILLNENISGWQVLKKDLEALEFLPSGLLKDVYAMDSEKYKNVDLLHLEEDGKDGTHRQIVFCLIPEILWASGQEGMESRVPYIK